MFRALTAFGAPPRQHRITGEIGEGIIANFISRDDLIQNKLASGRHLDLHDVEVLREAAPKTDHDL